jgi:ABC-type lipoprotein release transport system permease subunit
MNKINSYLGFAIKSRHIIFGVDAIIASRGDHLVLASSKLSLSSINNLKKNKSNVIVLGEEIYNSLGLNALAVAIMDKNLSDAIKKEITTYC